MCDWGILLGVFATGGFVGVMLMALLSYARDDCEDWIDEHEELTK